MIDLYRQGLESGRSLAKTRKMRVATIKRADWSHSFERQTVR